MRKHIKRGQRKTSRVKRANAAYMRLRRARSAFWAAFDARLADSIADLRQRVVFEDSQCAD